MKLHIYQYTLLIFLAFAGCTPQKASTGNSETKGIEMLKAHIQYLSDDKLEGRRTGSPGEKLAMDYIADQFNAIGIAPKGSAEYFQAFEVNDGKQVLGTTSLVINGVSLDQGKDYFPFPFSADKQIEAKPSIAIQESDMPWFYDLKDVLEENKNNPHFDINSYVYSNSKKAIDKGASAVLLYNSSAIDDKLVFNPRDRAERLTVPVIYISKPAAQKYFSDASASLDMKLVVGIGERKRTGNNVIGYIDNGAPSTVILGAHFDHLGYGEDGGSLNRTSDRMIHNGADDNASGTAALIELARILKTAKAKNNNYLFIAFSGEELGLYGSKYFTENPTIDLKSVSYMINMDMVGRLNDSSKVLTIGGFGTSPTWASVINNNGFFKLPYAKNTAESFIIRIDSSGTGPSDHTSFYRKDIPVLFYFTGLHSDYHKPSDDAAKINYMGEWQIIQHIYSIVQAVNDKGKLAFTKTREAQTSTNATFKVTLGIMPDYTFAGTGVRADGVTENRPAAKAGLKAGDIVIQIGSYPINSLENYMQALGKFQKGDKTKVKYKRGNETMEASIEF